MMTITFGYGQQFISILQKYSVHDSNLWYQWFLIFYYVDLQRYILLNCEGLVIFLTIFYFSHLDSWTAFTQHNLDPVSTALRLQASGIYLCHSWGQQTCIKNKLRYDMTDMRVPSSSPKKRNYISHALHTSIPMWCDRSISLSWRWI